MNAPLNTSDRKSIRAAEKAEALAERSRGEVVVALMSTEPGRRYVWDKLSAAGIFQCTFSIEPLQMAFNEGQRNQGLLLLNEVIHWCPDQFILAMRESNARRSSPSPAASQHLGSEEPDGGDSERVGDTADGSYPGPGDD